MPLILAQRPPPFSQRCCSRLFGASGATTVACAGASSAWRAPVSGLGLGRVAGAAAAAATAVAGSAASTIAGWVGSSSVVTATASPAIAEAPPAGAFPVGKPGTQACKTTAKVAMMMSVRRIGPPPVRNVVTGPHARSGCKSPFNRAADTPDGRPRYRPVLQATKPHPRHRCSRPIDPGSSRR